MIRLSLHPCQLETSAFNKIRLSTRRAGLFLPNQRFAVAFLAAQPHNILLYRNLFAAMIAFASRWRRKRITKSFKLVEAGD
jgi:hypothetical protein